MDGEVHEPGLHLEGLWKRCNAIYRLSTSPQEVNTDHCQNCATEHGNDAFVHSDMTARRLEERLPTAVLRA